MSENEIIIADLFGRNFSTKEKQRALSEAEADGSLADTIKRHHPEYYSPKFGVMKMRLLKDLGWI